VLLRRSRDSHRARLHDRLGDWSPDENARRARHSIHYPRRLSTSNRVRLWTMRSSPASAVPRTPTSASSICWPRARTGRSTPSHAGLDGLERRSSALARQSQGRRVDLHAPPTSRSSSAASARGDVTTSMTSTPASWRWHVLAGARSMACPGTASCGTMQNDMLKEFIAQKEWICPPEPAVLIVTDMIEFHVQALAALHPGRDLRLSSALLARLRCRSWPSPWPTALC